jgi:hypothetical protein
MKSLTLNSEQRLHLENMLGAQRGTAKDMFLLGVIIGAIRLDESEKKAANYRTIERGGQEFVLWDRAAAALMEPKTVELETEHARRLVALIDGWNNFTPADEAWVGPIIEALVDNPAKRSKAA